MHLWSKLLPNRDIISYVKSLWLPRLTNASIWSSKFRLVMIQKYLASVMVCHFHIILLDVIDTAVLRYSPYNQAVKQVIDSGALGEIINIQAIGTASTLKYADLIAYRASWKSTFRPFLRPG
jgi:hypothetical protein